MVNLLEHPEQLKAQLKDKWLDYYQENRDWLRALITRSNKWQELLDYKKEELEQLGYENYKPCCPQDCFILGIASVLEPQIRGLLAFAPDSPSTLVSRLGLYFDPEIELKKRFQQQEKEQHTPTDTQYLDQIREEIKT